MKKLLLTLTALLALGLAGCGNNANSSPTITQPPGASPVPAGASLAPSGGASSMAPAASTGY